MRLWVHTIWHTATGRVLQTAGPKENERFESMLHENGEQILAYAWSLYCFADPRPYNLEPVKHVDEFTSKKGNRIVREVENQASITRFPLSAFIAVAEGYIVKARIEFDEILDLPKERRQYHKRFGEISAVMQAIKQKSRSQPIEW
jgi:hypothetical protein